MKLWEQPWSQDEISPLPVIAEAMNIHDEYIIEDTKPADFSR